MKRNDRRRFLLGAGALALLAASPVRAAAAELELQQPGTLRVAVYANFAPYSAAGKGIDVALGRALAERLGLQPQIVEFPADENMNDDLRNMVWRGHYLGYGPADVLLHVPVDRPLMMENPQVSIFGPYWRERVVVARDLSKLPELDSLEPLRGRPVAVPGQSLAGWLMIGAESGMLRDSLQTKMDNGVIAAQMLQRGEVVAAAGLRSELESTLQGDPRFAIGPMPMPRAPKDGWAVGMATKKNATDLAEALQRVVNELAASGALKAMFAKGRLEWRPV